MRALTQGCAAVKKQPHALLRHPHLSQKTLTLTQQHQALCFWTLLSSYLVTVRCISPAHLSNCSSYLRSTTLFQKEALRMRICDLYSCCRCKLFSFWRRALSVIIIAPALLHGSGLRAADPTISRLCKRCKHCMTNTTLGAICSATADAAFAPRTRLSHHCASVASAA
jgi:hypothetical protein